MLNSNPRLIDLTQLINEHAPTWDLKCGFNLHSKCQYEDCTTQTKFHVQTIQTPLGIGTHVDAPLHCFADGMDVASIPLNSLIVPGYVIDVRHKVCLNYLLSIEEILDYEKQHGQIQIGSLVLVLTGWSEKWGNIVEYRSEDNQGCKHFPGVSEAAANLLLQRGIAGLGIDTLSPDGSNEDFPVHRILLGAGKYLLENLTGLEQLPVVGTTIIVMPMKIQNATEAPCRVIASL